MTATKTRREKVAAMAAQSASPEEAKVAANLLATMEKPRLEAIADEVRSEWGKGIESQFAVGRLLQQAWDVHGGDKVAYGRWCAEQNFPFHRNTGQVLRLAATREPEVRAYLAEVNDSEGSQRDIGVLSAYKELLYGPRQSQAKSTGEVIPTTDTTPADPAYAALRAAHRAVFGEDGSLNAFKAMHVEDFAKSAEFLQTLANAWTSAKAWRAMTLPEREAADRGV